MSEMNIEAQVDRLEQLRQKLEGCESLEEAVDLLGEFDARVHWGKLHYLTAEQLRTRYPRAADFVALRRELDPHGVFLNDHLRELFA